MPRTSPRTQARNDPGREPRLVATVRRLVEEWLDHAPSTLADPVGDLALTLERWVVAGCPRDEAEA